MELRENAYGARVPILHLGGCPPAPEPPPNATQLAASISLGTSRSSCRNACFTGKPLAVSSWNRRYRERSHPSSASLFSGLEARFSFSQWQLVHSPMNFNGLSG